MHFPCRCESNTSTLTDLIHREIESLQLGAASQEIRRNLLGGVLAHIEQLDLRKAQRKAKLPDTITEKRNGAAFTGLERDACLLKKIHSSLPLADVGRVRKEGPRTDPSKHSSSS